MVREPNQVEKPTNIYSVGKPRWAALSAKTRKMTDACSLLSSREDLIRLWVWQLVMLIFLITNTNLWSVSLREDKNAAVGPILEAFPRLYSCLFTTINQRKRNFQGRCLYTLSTKTPNWWCLSFPSQIRESLCFLICLPLPYSCLLLHPAAGSSYGLVKLDY